MEISVTFEGIVLEVLHRGTRYRVVFPFEKYIAYLTQVVAYHETQYPFRPIRATLPVITIPSTRDKHPRTPIGRLLLDLEHPYEELLPYRERRQNARYKHVVLELTMESIEHLVGAALAAGRKLYARLFDSNHELEIYKYNFSFRMVPRVLFLEGILKPLPEHP